MLRKEGCVDTNKHQSKVDFPVDLVVRVARDFPKSIIESPKYSEYCSEGENIMKVSYYIIGVM